MAKFAILPGHLKEPHKNGCFYRYGINRLVKTAGLAERRNSADSGIAKSICVPIL
jgi:hypothetical protein